ncbi:MAG: double-cubane-cluster-containing anaerobic reductase [Planctomycetota bacterium]|nr:double-cubane-cluster-containing anaerobic reductase [Planctomycetota bacterium]
MSDCCCGQGAEAGVGAPDPLEHFARMIPNCLAYANEAKAAGKAVVGILCEYTPRELIMAAGAVPVCLCGGSAKMIAPAEQHLPANLCPLIKSTYGYHLTKNNPFLEMADLIVAETTCDGKKKMYELMGETRPMYVLELPQRSGEPGAMEYWHIELKKLKKELEQRFRVEITDTKLRAAIGVMNRERRLRRELADLMQSDPPPLTGRQLLEFKSSISGICVDLAQYEKALEVYRNPDAKLSAKVRVMMTGVPIVHGAERVLDIIEGNGGVVVCMENCTGLKPILEDVNAEAADPLRALAEKYYHLPCSVMTRNSKRLEVLRQLAGRFRPQAVIELIWQACLTYDVEAFHTRRLVEEDLGLPYLRIETDYSPSDSARVATRVEAIFETVRQQSSI